MWEKRSDGCFFLPHRIRKEVFLSVCFLLDFYNYFMLVLVTDAVRGFVHDSMIRALRSVVLQKNIQRLGTIRRELAPSHPE